MAENVKMEMSSLTTLDTCVIQITNVAPAASLEQMSTLFGFLGKIEEIKLYPSEDYPILPQSKVCYVRYADSWSTGVAQHLTNTVFVDRALIVVPVVDGQIPDESHALSLTTPSVPGIVNPGPSQLINSVQTMGATQVFTTVDPNLTVLGLPQYPPLPANIDPSKIEEIRRTVYVGNLDSTTTTEQLLKFFNQVGEVKYVRMAGDETQPTRFAFVEFTDQSSVSKALQYNGIIFGSRPLKVNHSNNAIVKPQAKSSEAAQREIEEAMKRVREAQSLITAAIEPELSLTNNSVSSSAGGGGGGDTTDSKKKDSRNSHNSRSRSRSRKRSRSRERRKSRSKERKRSRSKGRRSASPQRSRSRGRRSTSRSRKRSPRKGSRERKSRRSASPRKSRSKSRDRKKRSRKSRSRTPTKSTKSNKSSRSDKTKSPKRDKSPKHEKSSPKKEKSSSSKELEDIEAATTHIDVVKKEPSLGIPFLEDTDDDVQNKIASVDTARVEEAELKFFPEHASQDKAKTESDQLFPEPKSDESIRGAKQESSPGRSSKGSRRSESKHKSPSHRRSHSGTPVKRKSRSPSKSNRRKSRSKSPSRKKRRSSRSPRRRSRSPRRKKGSPSPPPRRRSRSPSHSRSRSRSVRRKHRSPPRRRSRSPRRSPSYNRSRRRSPSLRRRSRTPRRRSRTPRKRSRSRTPPRKENKHKKKKDRDRSRDREKKKSKHRTGTRSPEKDVQTDGSDTKVRRDYDEEEKGYDSSGNEDHRPGPRDLPERGGSPGFDTPNIQPAKAKKTESDDSDHRSQQMDLDSD